MSQRCLLEQPFVKAPDQTIEQLISGKFSIVKFERFVLGEGLNAGGFIGLGLIYNLDKKTLAQMNADLGRDVEADDLFVVTTAEDNDNLVG